MSEIQLHQGREWCTATCHTCGWFKEAIGSRDSSRLIVIAQAHADQHQHAVELRHANATPLVQ